MTKVTTIKTDPEFDMLIQPYIGPALVTQKKKLRKNKDLRYIDVYNNSLIMDTQKLCVLQALNYEYKIKNHDFADKDAACLAICITQLSRTDLTTSYRKFLIGREFHYRQQVQKNMHLAKADTKCRIATTIGQQYSLASASIYRYSSFSEALTNIYINDPALAKEILMDICTISLGNIVELSRLKTDELHAVSKAYFSADQHKITHDFIRFEAMQRYNTSDKNPVDHEKEKKLIDGAFGSWGSGDEGAGQEANVHPTTL